jgi:DNA-binding MarR family transcriptional regulator
MSDQPTSIELTPNEARVYESIVGRTSVGNPPTHEDLRAEFYGTRKNTLPAIKRAVNTLEAKGLVDVTHSVHRGAEIVSPTQEKE